MKGKLPKCEQTGLNVDMGVYLFDGSNSETELWRDFDTRTAQIRFVHAILCCRLVVEFEAKEWIHRVLN
jgi:hypothetical protein